MLIIQNILFFNLIYFVGRGIFIFFEFITKKEIKKVLFGSDVHLFYPLITFFFIGNISFVLNFFLPIKNNFVFYFLCIFLFFNLKQKIIKKEKSLFLIFNLLFPAILGVTSFSVGFHIDAGLYHLNAQNWIINEKIVLGFSNIYAPYGFSTIYEYILSNFWFNNNFLGLHFVNLVFINTFYSFVFFFIFKSKNSFYNFGGIFILIFGLLDNFGLNGGRNGFFSIQGVGKVDNSYAVLFFLVSLFLIYLIYDNKFSTTEFIVISNLILFTIQMKVYGYTLFILYAFYILYKLIKDQNITQLLYKILPAIVLGALWLLKSVLQTACLVYPVSFTCFPGLSWYSDNAYKLTSDTRLFHNAYKFGDSLATWFSNFTSKEIDYLIFLNFLFSLILIYLLRRAFFISEITIKKSSTLVNIYILGNLAIFFVSAPTPRFLTGIFLIIIIVLGNNIKPRFNSMYSKVGEKIILILFMTVILLTPRVSDYFEFTKEPFSNRFLNPQNISYIQNNGWGEKPSTGELCWINLDCTETNIDLTDKLVRGYRIIEINSS